MVRAREQGSKGARDRVSHEQLLGRLKRAKQLRILGLHNTQEVVVLQQKRSECQVSLFLERTRTVQAILTFQAREGVVLPVDVDHGHPCTFKLGQCLFVVLPHASVQSDESNKVQTSSSSSQSQRFNCQQILSQSRESKGLVH